MCWCVSSKRKRKMKRANSQRIGCGAVRAPTQRAIGGHGRAVRCARTIPIRNTYHHRPPLRAIGSLLRMKNASRPSMPPRRPQHFARGWCGEFVRARPYEAPFRSLLPNPLHRVRPGMPRRREPHPRARGAPRVRPTGVAHSGAALWRQMARYRDGLGRACGASAPRVAQK